MLTLKTTAFLAPIIASLLSATAAEAADPPPQSKADPEKVEFRWGLKIPLRDGVNLAATLYRPREMAAAPPCVFTLTPYIGQSYHDRGMYFASHGYSFLTVDVRGRGNSEGSFDPLLQEAKDGHDVVEWLAKQPFCNGKVAMWGGSYAGYDQWATAKEFPPHLATIVPVASPYAGVDFPMTGNMVYPYDVQWLGFVSGHTSQMNIFGDGDFWATAFRRLYRDHLPFRSLDTLAGVPSPIFQRWVDHPTRDAFWAAYNPSAADYAKIDLPILTITGHYDGDQAGAFEHYRQHLAHASAAAKAKHFLVIGPWDHAGTRTPRDTVGGLKFGPASLVDLNAVHQQWYDWTMKDGKRPEFLQDQVMWYVSGSEKWRAVPTLDRLTTGERSYFLDSTAGLANDVFASGRLVTQAPATAGIDRYVYDPLAGRPSASAEAQPDDFLVNQTETFDSRGDTLIYHTAALARPLEIGGFFKAELWLAMDVPDTDIGISVSEIKSDGTAVLLSGAGLRARYREGLDRAVPVPLGKAVRYEFTGFSFVARELAAGSRLRLTIGPVDSPSSQKNYNSGGVVADETGKDARTAHVQLLHDRAHPSRLIVPIAE